MVGWAVAGDLKAHLHPWVKLSIGFGPARAALKHKPQNFHRSAAGTWKLNRTCPTNLNLNLSGSKRCPFGYLKSLDAIEQRQARQIIQRETAQAGCAE
eukprot:13659516-Alexandrium_andersonii.AAC.1